jgi:hypothetical protein
LTLHAPDSPPTGPDHPIRRWLFLGFYAFITLGALVLALYLAVLATTPLPTAVAKRPTSSPTPGMTTPATVTSSPSPSITATPAPSFTPSPSPTATITPTPTITPTRTPIALLTPDYPLLDNELYHLIGWQPEQASRMIELLDVYPDTLSAYHRGADNAGYYAAFRYAQFGEREALLRFPAAPQANTWLWRLAYDQARTGEAGASHSYAALITTALNDKLVDPAGLPAWGLEQFPAAAIEVIPLASRAGYQSSSLVKISLNADGSDGSAFFWLLESDGQYESYPLTSYFDFVHPTTVDDFVSDLIGNGSPQVAIYRSALPGLFQYILPQIFDLGQLPPVVLSFENQALPEIGPDFHNHWEPLTSGSEAGSLQFSDTLFPACPVTVRHIYDWNGTAFEYLGARYEFHPDPNLLTYCSGTIDQARSAWGPEVTLQLMEQLLPYWPPQADLSGNPFPADALDEWRYRLGTLYALLGKEQQAHDTLQAIVANPVSPASRWIARASDFLAIYQAPRDIYQACLGAPSCDTHLAFQDLVATFTPEDYTLAPEILRQAGVTLRSTGFFDFDGDGFTERWFVLRHQRGEDLEFWILAQVPGSVKALYVGVVTSNLPRITYLNQEDNPPVVQVEPDLTFTMQRQGNPRQLSITFVQPVTVFSADLTQEGLDAIQERLLSGSDPVQIRAELLALREAPVFTCSYLLCPQYQYLLGLTDELIGDPIGAVDAYLQLWRDYPDSPYTIMARLKLARIDLTATPTPVPTLTPTSQASLTPTASPTSLPPTQTASPTVEVATPTLSPIPTETPEPTNPSGASPTPTVVLGGGYPGITPQPYP